MLALTASLRGLETSDKCQLDEELDLTHRFQELEGPDVARFVWCFVHRTGAVVDEDVFNDIVTANMHGEVLASMSSDERVAALASS